MSEIAEVDVMHALCKRTIRIVPLSTSNAIRSCYTKNLTLLWYFGIVAGKYEASFTHNHYFGNIYVYFHCLCLLSHTFWEKQLRRQCLWKRFGGTKLLRFYSICCIWSSFRGIVHSAPHALLPTKRSGRQLISGWFHWFPTLIALTICLYPCPMPLTLEYNLSRGVL